MNRGRTRSPDEPPVARMRVRWRHPGSRISLRSCGLQASSLLAEAALLIVARLAPHLRVDDLAFSVRNIVFVSFLPIYAVFLIGYIRRDFGTLPGLVDLLRDTAPVQGHHL
jgi:hypothetical protein